VRKVDTYTYEIKKKTTKRENVKAKKKMNENKNEATISAELAKLKRLCQRQLQPPGQDLWQLPQKLLCRISNEVS